MQAVLFGGHQLGLFLTRSHPPGGLHPPHCTNQSCLVPPLPNTTNYSTGSLCSSGIMADFFQKQFLMSDLGCPEFQGYLTPQGAPEHLLPAATSEILL